MEHNAATKNDVQKYASARMDNCDAVSGTESATGEQVKMSLWRARGIEIKCSGCVSRLPGCHPEFPSY